MRRLTLLVVSMAVGMSIVSAVAAADPLPAWRDGKVKQAIVRFVEEVTQKGGTAFIPPAERIAVFDNDGMLWVEQPMYVQLAFALDRIKALAPAHPEWKDKQPFKAAVEGDLRTVAAGGEHALLELLMATHAGMTTDEFAQTVEDWTVAYMKKDWRRVFPFEK